MVEGEVSDVERAVRLDDGGEHPQHRAVRVHDRKRVHEILEAVVGAGSTNSDDRSN